MLRVNQRGGRIAGCDSSSCLARFLANGVLKFYFIACAAPASEGCLPFFENGAVAAFMHHDESLCTVRNRSTHDCGVIDVVSAGAKNRVRRIYISKLVNFQRGCPTGKCYHLGRTNGHGEREVSTGCAKKLANIASF